MKIDINDPRITAFALGELTGDDAVELARAVRKDARVRAAVDEVREEAFLLSETLGGGDAELLTVEHRRAIRSAGGEMVIEEFTGARVPFWRHPAVAGIGAAAVVAFGVYLVGVGPGDEGRDKEGEMVVDQKPTSWDWSKVSYDELMAPVEADGSWGAAGRAASEERRIVAEAIREDVVSFRKEVENRIERSEFEEALRMPELQDAGWLEISGTESLMVPLTSGAASWPWVKRFIEEGEVLPPRQAVRIEEMVNHFRYKKPTMIRGGGVVADVEVCRTPWNPSTLLLAVHVAADVRAAGGGSVTPGVEVSFDRSRVRRVRLHGYALLKGDSGSAMPIRRVGSLARSQGNYVVYEVEPVEPVESAEPAGALATLKVGESSEFVVRADSALDWELASVDLRFASVVTATGMVLAGTPVAGGVDVDGLRALLDDLEKRTSEGSVPELTVERSDALQFIRKVVELVAR